MRELSSYTYDVFLSWTGADKEIKNQIKQYFVAQGYSEAAIYDSDTHCKGRFRDDFCQAAVSSKLYVMLLTDNLLNDPNVSGGYFSEVRREVDIACEQDAKGELNIIILNLSPRLSFVNSHPDTSERVAWHFYCATRGYTQIYGVKQDGLLDEQTLDTLYRQANDFITKRNAGQPEMSQRLMLEIKEEQLREREVFAGRKDELDAIFDAYDKGCQVVVLHGMGGIGKTTVAVEFAREAVKRKFLHCPQVVHIRDDADKSAGGAALLYPVVSAVTYERDVYLSCSNLSQEDAYKRKLDALTKLPECVLLVLDNCNDLTRPQILQMLEKFRCKILITTRVDLEELDLQKDVQTIRVDKLNVDKAYQMFKEVSGVEISFEKFEQIYTIVGGHTITLCIIARMLKEHDVETVLSSLTEFDSMEEEVTFTHNDVQETATVMGHLSVLFKVNNFNDACKRVLTNMCLLNDGTIEANELKKALNLNTNNEINTLSKSWLEPQQQGEHKFLYLHPILSKLLCNSALRPDENNAANMINYLAQAAPDTYAELTFTEAAVWEDKLYYALLTLAKSSGYFAEQLWSKYVFLSRHLGHVEETKERLALLNSYLTQQQDKNVVLAFSGIMQLEQSPTRIDVITQLADILKANAEHYEPLCKALSVTIPHLYASPQCHNTLIDALTTAWHCAAAKKDDFAVMLLSTYLFVLDIDKAVKFTSQYVASRKKEGVSNGFLLNMQFIVNGKLFGDTASETIENGIGTLSNIAQENYKPITKMVLKHPIKFLKAASLVKKIGKVTPDDPLYAYLNYINSATDALVDDSTLDAKAIMEAISCVVRLQRERDLTALSNSDVLQGVLRLLSNFPNHLKGELKYLTTSVHIDMNNITIAALADTETAIMVGEHLQDKNAILHCAQLVAAEKKLYPREHYRVRNALLLSANTCATLGEAEQATAYRWEAYQLLKESAANSIILAELCVSLLINYTFLSQQQRDDIFDTLLKIMPDTEQNYYYGVGIYLNALLHNSTISVQRLTELTDDYIKKILTNELNYDCQYAALEELTQLVYWLLQNKTLYDNLNEYFFTLVNAVKSISTRTDFSRKITRLAFLHGLFFEARIAQKQGKFNTAFNNFKTVIRIGLNKAGNKRLRNAATYYIIDQTASMYAASDNIDGFLHAFLPAASKKTTALREKIDGLMHLSAVDDGELNSSQQGELSVCTFFKLMQAAAARMYENDYGNISPLSFKGAFKTRDYFNRILNNAVVASYEMLADNYNQLLREFSYSFSREAKFPALLALSLPQKYCMYVKKALASARNVNANAEDAVAFAVLRLSHFFPTMQAEKVRELLQRNDEAALIDYLTSLTSQCVQQRIDDLTKSDIDWQGFLSYLATKIPQDTLEARLKAQQSSYTGAETLNSLEEFTVAVNYEIIRYFLYAKLEKTQKPSNTSDAKAGDAPTSCDTQRAAASTTSAKPDFNGPCPCGSGKKYKFCCGQAEAEAAKKAWKAQHAQRNETQDNSSDDTGGGGDGEKPDGYTDNRGNSDGDNDNSGNNDGGSSGNPNGGSNGNNDGDNGNGGNTDGGNAD